MSRVGGLREAPLEGNPPTQRGVPRAGCLLGLGGGGGEMGLRKDPAPCGVSPLGAGHRAKDVALRRPNGEGRGVVRGEGVNGG